MTYLGTTPMGVRPMGYPGASGASPPVDDPGPIILENELANWLSARLGGADVMPGHMPQGDYDFPLLTYTKIAGETVSRMSGPSGLASRTYRLDSWAPDYAAACLAQAKVYRAMAGYRGPMGRATVLGIFPGREQSGYDPSPFGSDRGMFRETREYRIAWAEPSPIG